MPPDPDPQAPPSGNPNDGVTFATFSGLKNTVDPESLTARQLSRAWNVDLDDLGQIHRRRGRTRLQGGRWTSLFTTTDNLTFGVCNGALVLVSADGSTFTLLLEGISDLPLAFVEVGPTVYFSSSTNSGQIDKASLAISPWGLVSDHSYQPGLSPGPTPFWYSPVVNPDPNPLTALPPVAGKLLGGPPLGNYLCYHNGRIYIAQGPTLWATELFLYNYVDKTRGYRQFESDITGLISVEDGVYVGTRDGLYFLAGTYSEHTRTLREKSGVVPRSMVQAPGNMVDPEGKRFPDLPRPTSKAMACLCNSGVVVGLGGGQTYNLTRINYLFPAARTAPSFFRAEDGINALIMAMQAGGGPTESARFGDSISAELVKARATPGQPGDTGTVPAFEPASN